MDEITGITDRVYAEITAAPLRAQAAFSSAEIKTTAAEIDKYARERAEAHRRDLSQSAAVAHRAWVRADEQWRVHAVGQKREGSGTFDKGPWRIVSLLARTAHALLQPDGREMILRVDRDDPGREILRWRFVSLALPPDILLSAAVQNSLKVPAGVRLLHTSMAPDHPVAQQHVHHAAMLLFDELWASLRCRALCDPGGFDRSIRHQRALCPGLHPGPCLRGSRDEEKTVIAGPEASAKHMALWADLLRTAFIARRVLELHAGHIGELDKCKDAHCDHGRTVLRTFTRGRLRPYSFTGTRYPWRDEVFELARRYRVAYESSLARTRRQRSLFFREESAKERYIIARAFNYLKPDQEASADELFEKLLLQYLRVKTALYRLLVHPPGEHGLQKFLEHFSQIKVYEPRSDELTLFAPNEPGLNVYSTEFRVAPDAWRRRLGRREGEIEELTRQVPPSRGARARATVDEPSRLREAAWLIHFKRTWPGDGLPLFRGAIKEVEEEARQIGNALEQNPRRLRKLRGIDICGVEESQPLWVSAETLRRLRKRSSEIAGRRPGLRLQPLRLTLHAGEDFRWLTSGMRAVAEPFHWNLIERGDRIGHGIAVTLNPDRWWERHHGEVIPSTWIDRLQDLAFLAKYTSASGPVPEADRQPTRARIGEFLHIEGRTLSEQEWLSAEIEKAVAAIRFSDKTETTPDLTDTAVKFWTTIGGPTTRRFMSSSAAPSKDADLWKRWLFSYLWNQSVQKRATQIVRLPVDAGTLCERDLLVKAWVRLIRQLARWQVTVESNPSSNMVVGSLDAMASQDFLAQSEHQPREAGNETLPWTISTDDPITFATSLADEYAYAWAGMVLREEKPYDPAHARALLEEAAATSMRTRFTVPNHDDHHSDRR